MKHIIILGDGMSDHPVASLGGKTPLEYADTPSMDRLAREGVSGSLVTVPDGFQPGSEVANTAILGYDLNEVYEGRGPLEAASIGYEMQPDDMAMRCNLVTLADGVIRNHHGGHLTTEDGDSLIRYLNEKLGSDRVKFITGIQYRHLLVIRGGSKYVECAPPHDNPGKQWRPLLVKPVPQSAEEADRLSPGETADLLNDLILRSQQLLAEHPFNRDRMAAGKLPANSIWPWSGGYRPRMRTLQESYPQVRSGAVISAVDLIRGIGHYAGLRNIIVPGVTGLADTNYEGKAQAAIDALRTDDFVFLHIEATDEAGHDGDIGLKTRAIEYLDRRIVAPIIEEVSKWDEPVCIALLPDHATPVEKRIHVGEPVPFTIWYPGILPDSVRSYTEASCAQGDYGLLRLSEFMRTFMAV
ncbi:MAG: cofactor-independent phosphoglycerate mutase [Duncaniella sp.]|nr:cofactor-independent phosphoglycerate mutase [Duncaniella sp.]MDE7146234.1 cofactor-independent phosphoglycerate mutase [Duncaniella sp.]